MTIKPIKSKKDYQAALARLDQIFDAKPGSKDGDELEILGILIEKYEQDHYPIDYPDPIEAIKFRMEQLGYTQTLLARVVGIKSRASEVRRRNRKLYLRIFLQINHTPG